MKRQGWGSSVPNRMLHGILDKYDYLLHILSLLKAVPMLFAPAIPLTASIHGILGHARRGKAPAWTPCLRFVCFRCSAF